MRTLCILVFILLWAVPGATSVVIEGVRFDQRRQVVDADLQLTGAALLTWAVVFDAYVGAFYLPDGQPGSRWSEDVPKLLELSYLRHFKARDFSRSSKQLLREKLTEERYRSLAERVDSFSRLFRDVRPGDRYSLVYHPAIGTELRFNGEPLGRVAGHDFAVACFGLWLGAKPISEGFRERLLGR